MTVQEKSAKPLNSAIEGVVREHLNMVYAAALRQMGDAHAAADVTQAVFLILQTKMPAFDRGVNLPVWLLRTTRYACLAAKRHQRRRLFHETKVKTMRGEQQPEPDANEACFQNLDEAFCGLPAADRAVLVWVYFEGRTHSEIGKRLGIGTEAAHKRVQRAVEKLRKGMGKKGAAPGAVAGALAAAGSPAAAPDAVSTAVMGCVAGKVPAAVTGITKGTMAMMKVLKAKLAMVLAGMVVGTTLLGTGVFRPAEAQMAPVPVAAPSAAAPRPAAPEPTGSVMVLPADPEGGQFTAAVTLTIFDDGVRHDFTADLETGKTFTAPQEGMGIPFGALGWMQNHGIDLTYQSAASTRALVGIDMALLPAEEGYFDKARGADLLDQFLLTKAGTPAVMTNRVVPATYRIKTREGSVGVLEIRKVAAAPASVEIRYKLLLPAERDQLAAELAFRAVLPELKKQQERFTQALGVDRAEARRAAVDLDRVLGTLDELMRGTPHAAPVHKAALMAHLLADTTAEERSEVPANYRDEIFRVLGQSIERIEGQARGDTP